MVLADLYQFAKLKKVSGSNFCDKAPDVQM